MTDKSTEERALEQAVIDAVLNCSGFEPSLSVVLQAADKLRDFRAPKPKPRCEPPDADKNKPYHWLKRTYDGIDIPFEWANDNWYDRGNNFTPETIAEDYIYLCVATPQEPKVMPTEEAIEEFVTSHWLKGKAIEIRDIVRETLKHFSLPKPVDLPDADLRKIWLKWLSTRGSDCFSNFEKAARAVLAAGRGE